MSTAALASWQRRFKTLDIYRDVPKDLTEQTVTGATVSVISLLFIAYLFLSELIAYRSVEIKSSHFVDMPINAKDIDPHNDAMIMIQMNISCPSIPCALLSVDAQDIMGTHVVDVGGRLHKSRTDAFGNIKFNSNGIPLSESSVSPQEQIGEGCNVHGTMVVAMVPGNFHISAHAHAELLNTFVSNMNLNVSHTIHYLFFGETEELREIPAATLDPLKSSTKITHAPSTGQFDNIQSSYEYYIKVVPTQYEKLNGQLIQSYQYTANSHEVFGRYRLPAAYFRYDFSPITMKYTATRTNLAHFLVQVCAIIGGVFTVLGLVSASAHALVKKYKSEIGKLG